MNENLAFTFAEKAATKGLAAGEFALGAHIMLTSLSPDPMGGIGYYYELGIGTSKDLGLAKRWYTKVRLEPGYFTSQSH
jgi:hypothetical protein